MKVDAGLPLDLSHVAEAARRAVEKRIGNPYPWRMTAGSLARKARALARACPATVAGGG